MLTLILITMSSGKDLFAQHNGLVVIAKLVIDSAQLEQYKEALKIHAKIAVRVEPGVLNLYAVYEKSNPTHVTVFEIYADNEAYKAPFKNTAFLTI